MNKEKDKYELEDFLIDESFIEWVRGTKSASLFWTNYCENNPGKLQTIEQAKIIIQSLRVRDEPYSDDEVDRIKRNIERSIMDAEIGHLGKKNPSKPRYTRWAIKIAASLLIVAVSCFTVYYLVRQGAPGSPENAVELVEKSTQPGQKLTIYLSDGSKVKLNYNSRISYPQFFGDSGRVVRLSGEAFFEVAHDASRPFRVMTDRLNTEVLGTTFNVQAYPESETTEVVLVTGKVSITGSGDKIPGNYILSPGQAAACGRQSNAIDVSDIDVNRATAWKDGIILFEKASRQEVFERLGNWYGVEFELKNSPDAPWNYTGKFDNLSLENVLLSLSFVKDFDYAIQNNKVIIQFKK